MNTEMLNEFLATGKVTRPEVDAQDAMTIVQIMHRVDDPIFHVLATLCAIEMLAKDFHYRAKGKSFYGNHIFADLIWNVGKNQDDLNEIYYMGELQSDPPYRISVAGDAIKQINAIPEMANEDGYINAMYDRANALVGLVEKAKEQKKPLSGTTAVLDKISQDALQIVGFLKRALTGEESVTLTTDPEEEAGTLEAGEGSGAD